MLPADHLAPLWRLQPNHERHVFVLALDPREAGFVLGRGWATLDGERYLPSLDGWDGMIGKDGRVSLRFERA